MSLEKVKQKIQLYKDYIAISYHKNYHYLLDGVIKKNESIVDFRDRLSSKYDDLEMIVYFVTTLSKNKYPFFKQKLEELNKAELSKFVEQTELRKLSKEIKSQELKKKLKAYNLKYVLMNETDLHNLKLLIALI